MRKRPFQITLTEAERLALLNALYHWEDYFRAVRFAKKKVGEDIAEADRNIAKVRNLKARLFRMRAAA